MPSHVPALPWGVVGSDLFEWKGSLYLLVVDYLSRFPKISLLPDTSSSTVIERIKAIFARHGIPKVLRLDNGLQYSSNAFSSFADHYGFQHVPSSPNYPQSNGAAERMVKSVKALLNKASDPHLALMVYRSTPLANGFSPTEILMGRRIRTTIPLPDASLTPQTPNFSVIREKEKQARNQQKKIHDQRHRAQEFPRLKEGIECG